MKKRCSKNSKKVISGLFGHCNDTEEVMLLSSEVGCWLVNHT